MARRRAVIPSTGLFDTERHAAKLDRLLDVLTGPADARPEDAKDPAETTGPQGVSGAGGASTGFGRRAFGTEYDDVQWNSEIPYPQVVPTRTTDEERPRTVASGYDPGNQILRVTFREGAQYEYLGVPSHTWETYQRTPSPGRMIDDVLNQFFYRRID